MDIQSRLKVYFGPNERMQVNDAPVETTSSNPHVVVKLADILDPLTDAIETDRTWLKDFRDDEITISKDLHDVLVAYRRLRNAA